MDDHNKKSLGIGATAAGAYILSQPIFQLPLRVKRSPDLAWRLPQETLEHLLRRWPYALVTGAITGAVAHSLLKPMQKESAMNGPLFYGFNDELIKLSEETTAVTAERLEKIAAMPPWLKKLASGTPEEFYDRRGALGGRIVGAPLGAALFTKALHRNSRLPIGLDAAVAAWLGGLAGGVIGAGADAHRLSKEKAEKQKK